MLLIRAYDIRRVSGSNVGLLCFRNLFSVFKMNISKFKGCMLGSLLGDCLGQPYEGEETVSKVVLHKFLDTIQDPNLKTPLTMYTDDTVMTHAIAEMFVEKRTFDAEDLARRFVEKYIAEPRRGYGATMGETLYELKNTQFNDVFAPATKKFNGKGSWGNGAAMRVSPVSLFYHNNFEKMINVAKDCSKITHSAQLGIDGALLQCIAVNMCLHLDPEIPLDVSQYLSEISAKMKDIEAEHEEAAYCRQLDLIKDLLQVEPKQNYEEEVVAALGHSVAALYSVPTALYCFLRAQTPISHIKTDSRFRRTLELSISLGGDTDTIASMACAMSGAQLGESRVDPGLRIHCEGVQHSLDLAEQIYEMAVPKE